MKNFKLNSKVFTSTPLAILLAISALSACGPQAFVPGTVRSAQSAAGGMNIPPKVDILLGIDMKGAMQDIYPGLAGDITSFTNSLEQSGWDYRITSISLSESDPGLTYPLNQVSTSHYDSNWNSLGLWLSPFPGAVPSPALGIISSLFTQLGVSSYFPSSISGSANDGHKTGIKNEVDFLTRSDVRNNFLRNDALLAVVTLSDSKDTSYGTWQYRPMDGQTIWVAPNPDNTIANSTASLVSLKTNPLLAKYYAIVSHTAHSNQDCRGANTFSGIRYEQLAASLGGTSIDICNNTLTSALSQVSSNLNIVRLQYKKDHLVLATEPNVGTITVTKNGAPVPQDNINGWEYIGYQSNVNTIYYPIPMGQASGYMILLHGTSRLVGNDQAVVEYMNQGAVSAH